MPPLHPTILVGCGAYGQQVLTNLLAAGASRGRLTWEDPPGGAGPGERRIRDLSLISIPDLSDAADAAVPGFDEGTAILKDLYRQITRVEGNGDLEEHVRQAIAEARTHLLDVRRRESGARLRLGLDVFVIARPESLAALGALERLLAPAMVLLAGDTSLLRSAQGSDLLNFILILDFDHFWGSTAADVELRGEVTAWLDRMAKPPKPGFSRVYFSDRHTTDGSRGDEWRVAETALFLELLLFEGMRADETLRVLYQRERDDRALQIGSFGIRLLERSSGLLSRVAAAYFAEQWLEYLEGDRQTPQGAALRTLRSWLDHYRPERLNAEVDEAQFVAIAEQELASLEKELLDEPFEAADWPARVNLAAERGLRRLRRNLLDRARERARIVIETKLGNLADQLNTVVTETLHHKTEPEPAGSAIRELKELDESLHRPVRIEVAEAPAAGTPLVSGLDDVHRQYLRLRREQVDPARLKYWWPLLAATVAAGFTPFVVEAAHNLVPIDPTSAYPVRRLLELTHAWTTPFLVVVLLAIGGWLVCRYGFERAVRGRLTRAAQYFTDRERGRLAARVRWAVRQGPIRRAAEAHARQVFRETALRIHSEVQTQSGRVLRALRKRVLEMRWLRNQMREYLRSHGVDVALPGRAPVVRIDNGSLRHWIDLREDLSVLLRHNMPAPERFHSTQASLQPFASWEETYSDAFLHPVNFLDRVSQIYEVPEERRLLAQDERARADLVASVVTLLRTRSVDRFHPGFNWAASGDTPSTPQKYAIVPSAWEGMPGLSAVLREHGWTQVQSESAVDRLFLVQFRFGPPPEPA